MTYNFIYWQIFLILVIQNAAAEETTESVEYVDTLETRTFFDEMCELAPAADAHSSVNTRCGGILRKPIGHFSYRSPPLFEANERCVWTIRVQNATRYMVHVKQMDLLSDQNDTQIILTGISRKKENITDHFVPARENPVHFFNDINVVLVTFYTGNSVARSLGFTLEYSVLPNPDSDTTASSTQSRDHIDATSYPPTSIRHPNSGNYFNKELSLFVIAPRKNTFALGQQSKVLYRKLDLEGCHDALFIMKFNRNSVTPHKWENGAKICTDLEWAKITNSDLIVIVFRSDHSVTRAGFQLTYESGCDCDSGKENIEKIL